MSNAICKLDCSNPQRDHRSHHSIMGDTAIEVARLLEEQELFITHEGGVLPELEDLSAVQTILNVGCGPGTWAVEAASLFPDIQIIGIDTNQQVIDFARSRSRRLDNARFLVMDPTTLDFPDNTFDLVNAQYLQGTLTTTTWPSFIRDCIRVVRPGGIVRFTEAGDIESNHADFNRMTSLLPLSLYRTNRSLSPESNSLGIASLLGPLLQDAKCEQIRLHTSTMDYSSALSTYNNAVNYFRITYSPSLLGKFFVQNHIVSKEEYVLIYNKAMRAMVSPRFHALWYLLTISGKKQTFPL